MENIIVNANLLRAAKHYQAVNDVRYYLNGIAIGKDGQIRSTNGHAAFLAKDEPIEGMEADLIVRYDGKIPMAAEKAEFIFMEETTGIIRFIDGRGLPVKLKGFRKVIPFETVDGKFPDTDKIMPKTKPVPTESIALNPQYVAMAFSVCKDLGMRYPGAIFNFYGEHASVMLDIDPPNNPSVSIIIMPMRM